MNVLNIHGEDDDDEPSEPGGEGGSDSGSGVSACMGVGWGWTLLPSHSPVHLCVIHHH